jgi:hypothetical protein
MKPFCTCEGITKEELDRALDEAFKVVIERSEKEMEDARNIRTRGRPRRRWGYDPRGGDAGQALGH